jgi:hypothetical protein
VQYKYTKIFLSKKFLKNNIVFCFKSSTKINKFFLKKKFYVRKGLYYRKIVFNKHTLGSLTSSFLVSRKPFNRILKKKKDNEKVSVFFVFF